MANKKNYDKRAEALKNEFSSKPVNEKKIKPAVKYILITAVVAVIAVAVVILADALGKRQEGSLVDWESYGRDYSTIRTDYADWDRVIANVNGNEIQKLDFYKLRISQDYMYDSFLKSYEDYIEANGSGLSEDAKEALKPKRLSDEELLEDLIATELGYVAAMDANVKMDYDIALSNMEAMYSSYLNILETTSPDADVVKSAREFVDQANLVAKGMGVETDVYIRYLAYDSMKSMAITILEEIWIDSFVTDDFDGTVDEYIAHKHSRLKDIYQVEVFGLE